MKPSAASIRVLVVDGEVPARLRLRDFLAKDVDVSEVYEAANGEEAVRLIEEEKPELVLLTYRCPD